MFGVLPLCICKSMKLSKRPLKCSALVVPCVVWFCRLDLDAWINEPPSESESEDEKPKTLFAKEEPKHSRPRHAEVDEKELARVCIPALWCD